MISNRIRKLDLFMGEWEVDFLTITEKIFFIGPVERIFPL